MLGLSIWWRLVFFAGCEALGFWLLLHPLQAERLIGRQDWAERHLGTGGSYSAMKLYGIGLILLGLIFLFKG